VPSPWFPYPGFGIELSCVVIGGFADTVLIGKG
jgi:hypothetical protein